MGQGHENRSLVPSLSLLSYYDFGNATNHLGSTNHVREVERIVDRWVEMTKHIAPMYHVDIEKEQFAAEEHESIIHALKDELPVGEYIITVQVNQDWEEWKSRVYVTGS